MITPPSVQEPSSTTHRNSDNRFLFAVCQHGCEGVIKENLLGNDSPLRLAYSRPGLLTFKIASPEADSIETEELLGKLRSHCLIRLAGIVLTRVSGSTAEELSAATFQVVGVQWPHVHVFQRDQALPGIRGYEPGPSELSESVGDAIRQSMMNQHGLSKLDAPSVNLPVATGERILDVILIEPDQWLVGMHTAHDSHERWPGGVIVTSTPEEMISRAYWKMAEAVAWASLPLQPGDKVVEIGSAPGGSCQRLLDMGLFVTGIDPAEMDPTLLQHPRFRHWRKKASAVRRRYYAEFQWLTADANVAPNYTLDFVGDIVCYPTSRFRGLILTLKLSSYDLLAYLDQYLQRIRSWGFPHVQIRQLSSNRRECCVVATRDKDWRPSAQANTTVAQVETSVDADQSPSLNNPQTHSTSPAIGTNRRRQKGNQSRRIRPASDPMQAGPRAPTPFPTSRSKGGGQSSGRRRKITKPKGPFEVDWREDPE